MAEDIATEAMMTLWNRIQKGEHIEMQLSFLFGVVRNKVMHYLRHLYVKKEHEGSVTQETTDEIRLRIDSLQACDPETLFSKEVMSLLDRGLSEVGDSGRKVFCLSRYNGLSNKEISQQLGIAEKTVEFHMTKVLKHLRVVLKDYLPAIHIFLNI